MGFEIWDGCTAVIYYIAVGECFGVTTKHLLNLRQIPAPTNAALRIFRSSSETADRTS